MSEFFILLVGLVIGIFAGIFGIGGGVVAIPMLGLFFGLNEQLAQGTAMLMIVSNLLVSMTHYAKAKLIDVRAAIIIALSSIVPNIVCSLYATRLPSASLRIGFAVFLSLLAIETVRKAFARKTQNPHSTSYALALPWAIALGVLSGVLGGLFGIGGGLFTVAVLALRFRYPQAVAQGVSTLSVLPGALINLYVYQRAGDIQFSTGFWLALGGLVTVPLGVKIAARLPERLLKLAFASLAAISALALVAHSSR